MVKEALRPALAALLLAGCAPSDGQSGRDVQPARGLTLVPAPGGLEVAGSGGREIGFGRDRAGALESAARVAGRRPEAAPCAAPGRDAARLGDLTLVFERGAFVGWATADGAAAGARCGQGRASAPPGG